MSQKNRAEAREIMEKLGYGPDKRLAAQGVDAQHPGLPRSGGDPDRPAEGDLSSTASSRSVETANWFPKVMRKDYTIGAQSSPASGVDDPDQQFYENYVCGSPRNYTGYCNPELDKLIDRQSMRSRPGKRKKLVWEIERKLAEDGARPIIFYPRRATCWQP